jgi:hypothetical protein
MIIYDLLCACGFQFEGWFHDQEGFREQQRQGLLSCPTCGGAEVHKILSPVAVHTNSSSAGQLTAGRGDDNQAALAAAALHTLQEYVRKNFEDVGPRLASKALKIHYGLEEPRNIRGVASPEEEKTLREEGIKLHKIPMPEGDDTVN